MILKKALIRNCIWSYIEEHKLETIPQVFEHLPAIYLFLKDHPHYEDLIPENLNYTFFAKWAQEGLRRAANHGNIFSKLKKQFNSI